MPLELVHNTHPNFLEVHLHGKRKHGHELEEAIALWSTVFAISNQQNRLNILAHNRARGRFSVKAQINLAFKIQEMGCTLAHRIAVISYNSEVFKNGQLIVRFMQGKGYTIQLFKNKDKAKRWLLQNKEKVSLRNLLDSFK